MQRYIQICLVLWPVTTLLKRPAVRILLYINYWCIINTDEPVLCRIYISKSCEGNKFWKGINWNSTMKSFVEQIIAPWYLVLQVWFFNVRFIIFLLRLFLPFLSQLLYFTGQPRAIWQICLLNINNFWGSIILLATAGQQDTLFN